MFEDLCTLCMLTYEHENEIHHHLMKEEKEGEDGNDTLVEMVSGDGGRW